MNIDVQGFNQSQQGAMDMMRKETQSREQEIQQIGMLWPLCDYSLVMIVITITPLSIILLSYYPIILSKECSGACSDFQRSEPACD